MYEYLINLAKTCFDSHDDKDLAYKFLCVAWVYLIFVGVQSFWFPAPYGKFTSATGIGFLTRLTKIQMPASFGWMLQEIPSFLVSFCALVHLYQRGMILKMLLLTPYVAHYFNRSILFPLKMKNGKPAPLLTVGSAFVFCLYNGLMQSHAIVSLDLENLSLGGSALGLAIFVGGMGINIQSDQILKNLRKEGETGYKIPYGGLYEYVTCPNYFGEALEWWGFACVVQTSAGVWFGVWSTMFLGGRALQTHSWYKEKFKEYPQERGAFIPGIL